MMNGKKKKKRFGESEQPQTIVSTVHKKKGGDGGTSNLFLPEQVRVDLRPLLGCS